MGTKIALTGNHCASRAAALCRPDVIAAYPITPQSSVVESLADFVYELVSQGQLGGDAT